MSTPKTPISALFASPNRVRERDGRLGNSSGEWIRTTDLRVTPKAPGAGVSKNPESVPFVRRALQTLALPARASVSQPDELWFLLARQAAIVDRCAYSILFTRVRQVP